MIIGESLASLLEIIVSALLAPLSAGRRKNEELGHVVHLVVLLLVRGISREREYLADSDARRVTGDGRALAEALSQITRAYQTGSISTPPERVESLCFAGAQGLSAALATHPPVDARVERLLSELEA
jgi:heat shock protein HtpX